MARRRRNPVQRAYKNLAGTNIDFPAYMTDEQMQSSLFIPATKEVLKRSLFLVRKLREKHFGGAA